MEMAGKDSSTFLSDINPESIAYLQSKFSNERIYNVLEQKANIMLEIESKKKYCLQTSMF